MPSLLFHQLPFEHEDVLMSAKKRAAEDKYKLKGY
jgi:hypothetical protein